MAVTIVVRSPGASESAASAAELSLTLDTPRLVIGRGEGCEVRLPDPSVSHRHASLRQRGGEYVLVDENSQNGTWLGSVRLPPHTPRAVKSGDLVRVGRVWLEVRIEPALVKGSTAAAAKEMALALVARGMEAQGEAPWPRLTAQGGPDQGKSLVLAEGGRSYRVGRARDADLVLDDPRAARLAVALSRKGDALLVQDVSGAGAWIDGAPLGPGETVWRAGQELASGGNVFTFDYPAAAALAELERCPDERMRPDESPEPPAAGSEPAAGAGDPDTPAPAPAAAIEAAPKRRAAAKKGQGGGFGLVDAVVMLLALGVLAGSIVGAYWLFGK